MVLPRGHAIPSTMVWFPMTGWLIACNHWHVALVTFWSWLRFQIPNKLHMSTLIVVAENHIPLFSSFSAIVSSLSQCDLIRLIWGVCYDNHHTWLCKLHSCSNKINVYICMTCDIYPCLLIIMCACVRMRMRYIQWWFYLCHALLLWIKINQILRSRHIAIRPA